MRLSYCSFPWTCCYCYVYTDTSVVLQIKKSTSLWAQSSFRQCVQATESMWTLLIQMCAPESVWCTCTLSMFYLFLLFILALSFCFCVFLALTACWENLLCGQCSVQNAKYGALCKKKNNNNNKKQQQISCSIVQMCIIDTCFMVVSIRDRYTTFLMGSVSSHIWCLCWLLAFLACAHRPGTRVLVMHSPGFCVPG